MKYSKNQIINYYIDCLGYNEDESNKIFCLYSPKEYLNKEQYQDFINYIK